ncbi:hypothetical protein GLYMA_12G138900v4 [Glycine max]|nr:hypothetical protein GLYMA_12G138900v4 [Glycine max]KAH1143077.1 hypothetical protein GYH30_033671 [Glycine max]
MTCYMMHTTCLHFVAGSILAHCQCIMKTKAFKRSRSHDFLQVPNEYAYTSLSFYVHEKQPSTVQIEVLVLPLVGLWLDLQWPCLCFTL